MALKQIVIGVSTPRIILDAMSSLGASGLIMLTTDAANSTGKYSAFRSGGAAYQVTAGKTLYTIGAFFATDAAAQCQMDVGSATVTSSNATIPTGYISFLNNPVINGATILNLTYFPWVFKFAATTFPTYFMTITAGAVHGYMFGFEE